MAAVIESSIASLTAWEHSNQIVEEAQKKIQWFLNKYGPEFLWVLVSGGKDSAAVWALTNSVTRDYVAVFVHIAGQTHGDNVKAVYDIARRLNVHDVVRVRVDVTQRIMRQLKDALESCGRPCLMHIIVFTHRGEDFWQALMRYGYPAPLGRFGKGTRWCCGTFKHRVFGRLPYNGRRNGEPWRYGVDGVKATDSPYRRKKYISDILTWERTRDTYLFPLRFLTDEQVWEILRRYDLYDIVYRQYERWGRAPNCMFCPMVGRRELIAKTVEAMPESMRKLVYSHLYQLLPCYKETTFSYKSIKKWLKALENSITSKNISESITEIKHVGKPDLRPNKVNIKVSLNEINEQLNRIEERLSDCERRLQQVDG